MPLGKNVRYRVKTSSLGKKVRLAFRGNQVIEATPIRNHHLGKSVRVGQGARHGP